MEAAVFSALLANGDTASRTQIAQSLAKFGEGSLRFAVRRGIRVYALSRSERYDCASPALKRLGIDVDQWPAAPAGLFVLEERTMYLRSRSPMTVAHEFGHALDCALGNGIYYSSNNPDVRPQGTFQNRTLRNVSKPHASS